MNIQNISALKPNVTNLKLLLIINYELNVKISLISNFAAIIEIEIIFYSFPANRQTDTHTHTDKQVYSIFNTLLKYM